MVRSNIITRVTDDNIFRERVWCQCSKCGHKFEYYNNLFSHSKRSEIICPKCQSELLESNSDLLD